MPQRIGMIGIGLMGHGIALNLMKHGHSVVAMAHRSRKLVDDLLSQGATEAATPRAVAEASDVVLTCVTGAPAVEEIMFGDTGVIAGCRDGMLVIDCSTGLPDVVGRVADALAATGADFADAPLARTPVEAAAGKLNTMVGASDATFARTRPILECFCENIFHMGGPGAGTRMKLINNVITMGQAALIAEAMVACKATGVDLQKFREVISAGGGNSGIFQMVVPAILDEGHFDGMKFSLANAAKDLGYFTEMAGTTGLQVPLATEVRDALLEAVTHNPDGLVAALVEVAAKRNGLTIGAE